MVFLFQKKSRYLKSRISTKFHHLVFLFYFFSIFVIFFSISPIQTCQKIRKFFVVFYSKDQKFYQRILEISKSSFTKIEICEIFFFQNSTVYYLFFYFSIIFAIFFNFVYMYFSKIFGNFYVFLIYRLEILSKIFEKSWNVFLKNIDI